MVISRPRVVPSRLGHTQSTPQPPHDKDQQVISAFPYVFSLQLHDGDALLLCTSSSSSSPSSPLACSLRCICRPGGHDEPRPGQGDGADGAGRPSQSLSWDSVREASSGEPALPGPAAGGQMGRSEGGHPVLKHLLPAPGHDVPR